MSYFPLNCHLLRIPIFFVSQRFASPFFLLPDFQCVHQASPHPPANVRIHLGLNLLTARINLGLDLTNTNTGYLVSLGFFRTLSARHGWCRCNVQLQWPILLCHHSTSKRHGWDLAPPLPLQACVDCHLPLGHGTSLKMTPEVSTHCHGCGTPAGLRWNRFRHPPLDMPWHDSGCALAVDHTSCWDPATSHNHSSPSFTSLRLSSLCLQPPRNPSSPGSLPHKCCRWLSRCANWLNRAVDSAL